MFELMATYVAMFGFAAVGWKLETWLNKGEESSLVEHDA